LLLVLAAHGVADEDTASGIVTQPKAIRRIYTERFRDGPTSGILSRHLGADRLLVSVDVVMRRLGTIRIRNVNRALLNAIPFAANSQGVGFLSSRETERPGR